MKIFSSNISPKFLLNKAVSRWMGGLYIIICVPRLKGPTMDPTISSQQWWRSGIVAIFPTYPVWGRRNRGVPTPTSGSAPSPEVIVWIHFAFQIVLLLVFCLVLLGLPPWEVVAHFSPFGGVVARCAHGACTCFWNVHPASIPCEEPLPSCRSTQPTKCTV